jgi:hypothetical protein
MLFENGRSNLWTKLSCEQDVITLILFKRQNDLGVQGFEGHALGIKDVLVPVYPAARRPNQNGWNFTIKIIRPSCLYLGGASRHTQKWRVALFRL